MAHLSSFCSTVRRPRTAPLVPSTTLFRSPGLLVDLRRREPEIAAHARRVEQLRHPAGAAGVGADERDEHTEETTDQERSEEHTSELQSRGHLVCRLLLEKKKNNASHLYRQ